ncbi:MAG: peptidylprolyl isomerase [Rikenellaceae bacterium]|nr:peptidylprolyl isomerase [Rikenellaceae bacterium]
MKRILLMMGLVWATTFLGGYRAGAQERTMIGEEIVAVVGNSMILWSDVVDARQQLEMQQRQQGFTSNRDPQCEALEMLLMQKILANQARIDSLEVNTGYVETLIESRVEELMDQYGSMLALEAVYRKPVYQIRDDLRERYMDMMLAQSMEGTIRSKVTVIPTEVDRFYRRISRDSLPMVPEQYVYSQIVMYPPSIEDAKLRARERLLEFRQRIIEGENFEVLARLYSDDPGSRPRGGKMEFMPKEGFVRPFAEALEKLKIGQISPVVETEFGFHIIEVLEKKGDNYRVRHILIRPSFTDEEMIETAHRLDSVGQLIRQGELTFEEAALEYSQDNYSKYNGGEVTNREYLEVASFGQAGARETSNRFVREELFGDDPYVRVLKPGEVSTSYITQDLKGNQQVKIIMLKEIVEPHRANIRDDYSLIEDMALDAKQEKEYQDWLKKKIQAMYVRIDPKFTGCEFEYDWIK